LRPFLVLEPGSFAYSPKSAIALYLIYGYEMKSDRSGGRWIHASGSGRGSAAEAEAGQRRSSCSSREVAHAVGDRAADPSSKNDK